VVRWGLPVVKTISNLGAAAMLGSLVLALFSLRSGARSFEIALDTASIGAAVYTVASAVAGLFTFLQTLGVKLSAGPEFGAQLGRFLLELPLGQAWLMTVLAGAVITIAAFAFRGWTATLLTAILAAASFIPLATQGHAGELSGHDAAVNSLLLHTIGAGVDRRPRAADRAARIPQRTRRDRTPWRGRRRDAAKSGAKTGDARSEGRPQSAGAKKAKGASRSQPSCAATPPRSRLRRGGGLGRRAIHRRGGRLGRPAHALRRPSSPRRRADPARRARRRYRTRLIPKLETGGSGPFWTLVLLELALMGIASGLAAALSRTPPPTGLEVATVRTRPRSSPARCRADPIRWITAWNIDLIWAVAAAFGIVLYLGVLRLRRRGDAWPIHRTVFWILGCRGLCGSPGRDQRVPGDLFSVHMLGHMMLSMAIPLLLVSGAPVTRPRAIDKRDDGTAADGSGSCGPCTRRLARGHQSVRGGGDLRAVAVGVLLHRPRALGHDRPHRARVDDDALPHLGLPVRAQPDRVTGAAAALRGAPHHPHRRDGHARVLRHGDHDAVGLMVAEWFGSMGAPGERRRCRTSTSAAASPGRSGRSRP
jgi:putative copper resistance protein D